MNSRWWIAAALYAGFAAREAGADSACIASQVYCGQYTTSSAPSLSVGCYSQRGHGIVSYDITAGTLSAFGQGGFVPSVTMTDSFQVVGPPDGTPLDFAAQLMLSGEAHTNTCDLNCCFGVAGGRIQEGASNRVQADFRPSCGAMGINMTVEVQVRRASGERFLMVAVVYGGGDEGGRGDIRGTLRFSGLPEGASVVSCNGFRQDVPLPVVRASWGQLKTTYR